MAGTQRAEDVSPPWQTERAVHTASHPEEIAAAYEFLPRGTPDSRRGLAGRHCCITGLLLDLGITLRIDRQIQ